jgi:apolipoprotein N-acyltransferase
VLLILSYPDFGISRLAWVALAPLLYVLVTQPLTLKRSFVYGVVTGAVFFYGSCYWITYSIIHYGDIESWVAYSLGLIPAVALGAFWGPWALGVRWAVRQRGMVGLFMAPPLWAVMEWGRYQGTGMGWNALGYSQAFRPELIQAARYAGVYGVGFLLVGVSSVLAAAIVCAVNLKPVERTWRRQAAVIIAMGGVLVLIIGGFQAGSRMRLTGATDNRAALRVLAIQPNIPIEVLTDPEAQRLAFDGLLSLTERELAAQDRMDLVIWPESPLNLSLYQSPEIWPRVQALVRHYEVYLLLNVIGETPPDQFHNSAAVFHPNGHVIAEYHKVRLLPFGEYVPLRGWLPLIDRIPALAGDFSPGHDYTVVDLGQARLGAMICSESANPEVAGQLTTRGATLLVELTNDSWFGPTAAARQHLAHAIFRAVENHRDLIRVTNNGISVHITPEGKLAGPTALLESASREWTISWASRSNTMTFYARHGDLFILFCALAATIIAGLGLAGGRRAREWHQFTSRKHEDALIIRNRWRRYTLARAKRPRGE